MESASCVPILISLVSLVADRAHPSMPALAGSAMPCAATVLMIAPYALTVLGAIVLAWGWRRRAR